jgi:Zn-dependent protease with chaperone function
MHTQTQSSPDHLRRRGIVPGAASGLALYLVTIAGEVILGAPVRWLLFYFGAAIVGAFVPLGLSAEAIAWIAAAAPLGRSALGLVLPGQARLWRRRLGARRPSEEEAMAVDDALALLHSVDPSLPAPLGYFVLDDPLPGAAVRARALILSRGLLESESLAAVLAHELGHLDSLDSRLTEALNRLPLWGDPLAPVALPRGAGAALGPEPDSRGALTWGLLRWTLRLGGGSFARSLLSPFWAAYWRSREYAADAYAASLGQAEDLARHLRDQEQPFDAPHCGLLRNGAEHPPVALRVERLLQSAAVWGSE